MTYQYNFLSRLFWVYYWDMTSSVKGAHIKGAGKVVHVDIRVNVDINLKKLLSLVHT